MLINGFSMLPALSDTWTAPALPEELPHGDMPGDKIVVGEDHIRKAQLLFPRLLDALRALEGQKAVVSVFGGSGVGKSEIIPGCGKDPNSSKR